MNTQNLTDNPVVFAYNHIVKKLNNCDVVVADVCKSTGLSKPLVHNIKKNKNNANPTYSKLKALSDYINNYHKSVDFLKIAYESVITELKKKGMVEKASADTKISRPILYALVGDRYCNPTYRVLRTLADYFLNVNQVSKS